MSQLVSVVVPAYKAEAFLEECLRSVLEQTYRPLELVVVDDASPDGTSAVARRLAPEFEAHGIELNLLTNPVNRGASASLARGFEESRGELVCWLSADDAYIEPNKTKTQVDSMTSRDCAVSFSRSFRIGPTRGESEQVTWAWLSSPRTVFLNPYVEASSARTECALWFGNAINGSSTMVSRRAYASVGGFDPVLLNVDADADLWMRLMAVGWQAKAVAGSSLFYRVHPNQTSQSDPTMLPGAQATRMRMIRGLAAAGRLAEVTRRAALLMRYEAWRGIVPMWPGPAQALAHAIQDERGVSAAQRRLADRLLRRLDGLSDEDWRVAEEARVLAKRAEDSAVWVAYLETLSSGRKVVGT